MFIGEWKKCLQTVWLIVNFMVHIRNPLTVRYGCIRTKHTRMARSREKCSSKRKSNISADAPKKAAKKPGPIRRWRQVPDDRPVDFSGKKYFMVVRRTIPRNERSQDVANVRDTTGPVNPLTECKTCQRNNEFLESLEDRIGNVANAASALTAISMDGEREKNITAEVELRMTLANMVSIYWTW